MLDQFVFVEGGRSESRWKMSNPFMNFTGTGGVDFGRRCRIDLWISQWSKFRGNTIHRFIDFAENSLPELDLRRKVDWVIIRGDSGRIQIQVDGEARRSEVTREERSLDKRQN